MNQPEWEIRKYVTNNGLCPFDEWFTNLDSVTQARIDVRLDRVSLGNFGDHRSVGDGVYELRFFFGPGYRIYYGIVGNRIVLLLTGGSKKRQSKDVIAAQKFWASYHNE